MAKSRGFLAELNRQGQIAARNRAQAARQAERAQAKAQREAAAAAKAAERSAAALLKATGAAIKQAEADAKRLHIEAMETEVAARNARLVADYDEIDSILSATLDVDDYVDLEDLRQVGEHPAFEPGQLAFPAPAAPRLTPPVEPAFVPPDGEPKGLSGVFGGKKKYAETVAQARAEFDKIHGAWQAEVAALPGRQAQLDFDAATAEQARQDKLRAARAEYDAECARREAEVVESNEALDRLIANLGYDVEEAIQEYVAIVLSNSVYPDCFPVSHDFTFDSSLRELVLKVVVPEPASVPGVKEYRYVKAKDEIVESSLPQKDQKERYGNAVAQVALRTLHEVFEADRVGRIQTISLTVATEAIDAGTGQMAETPLVAVASDRATFAGIELANVVPAATLQHLRAQVSKNPYGLVPVDLSKGVRG